MLQQEWTITRKNAVDYSAINSIVGYYKSKLPTPVYDVWVQKQQFTSVLDPSQNGNGNPNDDPNLRTNLYILIAIRPLSTATPEEIETLRLYITSISFVLDITNFLKNMFRTSASMYRVTSTGMTQEYPAYCQDGERTQGTTETDVDCGGEVCDQCYGGSTCRVSTDCFSLRCLVVGTSRYCAFWGLNTDSNAAGAAAMGAGALAAVVVAVALALVGA